MLKHRIKDRTAGILMTQKTETPRWVCDKDVVILTEYEWRNTEAFDRLIRQHLAQYQHLGIYTLASSIVRHWIGNQGGRFIHVTASGEAQQLTDEPSAAAKVAALIHKVLSRAAEESAHLTRNVTPLSQITDAISTSSPFGHSLGEIHEVEEPKKHAQLLLPMIPQDIFVQPLPPSSPQKSPRHSLRSINMKPLQQNIEIVQKLEFRGIPIKKSLAKKSVTGSVEASLSTPKTDNTSGKKKRAARSKTVLPLRKRFKKSVSVDTSTNPPSNGTNDELQRPACAPLPAPPSTLQVPHTKHYTKSDVLFAGAWTRDHKGNVCLNEWMSRFCKNVKARDTIEPIAKKMVSLFKTLSSRFLEAKTSSLDGSTVWVELEEQVVSERITACIQNLLDEKEKEKTSLGLPGACLLPGACSEKLKRKQKVQILRIDFGLRQIRPGNDFIMLESTVSGHLSTDDVILGEHDGRETHCGNLKFLHHVDNYIPKYERAMSMGSKLGMIRKIINAWKKLVEHEVRFIVPNGDVFSIVEAHDELTVLLGVAKMIQKLLQPIPYRSPEIYLGDQWTIQRAHRRNSEYHKLLSSNMKAYGVVAKIQTQPERFVEELSLAGNIVREIGWEAYPTGPFKGGFKVFDTKKQGWTLVSVEDAVKKTLILLRLKAYFSEGSNYKFVFDGPNPNLRHVEKTKAVSTESKPRPLPEYMSVMLVVPPANSTERTVKHAACVQAVLTPAAPRTPLKSNTRSGAKSPWDLLEALLDSPKGSPSSLSLLQADLWSPTTSPEKGACLGVHLVMSPPASPTKSLVRQITSTPHAGPTSITQPIARRSAAQPGLVPSMRPNSPPTWVPRGALPQMYSNGFVAPPFHSSGFVPPQLHSNGFMPPQLHNNGYMPQQLHTHGFVPPQFHRLAPPPMHRPHLFPVRGPDQQLVWVPFSVPFTPPGNNNSS